VMTSRTAMAFPPVPHSVSTSIMTCPLPRQARPGMAKKLNGLGGDDFRLTAIKRPVVSW
jgi:hypothetical protein